MFINYMGNIDCSSLGAFRQPLRKALLERFRNVAETGAGGPGLKDSCGVGAIKGFVYIGKDDSGFKWVM